MDSQEIDSIISELRKALEKLLGSNPISYSTATPSSFPDQKGIYIISSNDGQILRAGKTGLGNAKLRQRLYSNHLMGSQGGNLPAQLVGSRECSSLLEAKDWIRRKCSVRVLPIEDDATRSRVEHFMLAIVQPRFCDNNRWDREG
jgi:hypothetical protein